MIVGTILVQVLQFVIEVNVLNAILDAAFDVDVTTVILNDVRILWLKNIGFGSQNFHLVASSEVCSWTFDGTAGQLHESW